MNCKRLNHCEVVSQSYRGFCFRPAEVSQLPVQVKEYTNPTWTDGGVYFASLGNDFLDLHHDYIL
jgi:hypothetical protein